MKSISVIAATAVIATVQSAQATTASQHYWHGTATYKLTAVANQTTSAGTTTASATAFMRIHLVVPPAACGSACVQPMWRGDTSLSYGEKDEGTGNPPCVITGSGKGKLNVRKPLRVRGVLTLDRQGFSWGGVEILLSEHSEATGNNLCTTPFPQARKFKWDIGSLSVPRSHLRIRHARSIAGSAQTDYLKSHYCPVPTPTGMVAPNWSVCKGVATISFTYH